MQKITRILRRNLLYIHEAATILRFKIYFKVRLLSLKDRSKKCLKIFRTEAILYSPLDIGIN